MSNLPNTPNNEDTFDSLLLRSFLNRIQPNPGNTSTQSNMTDLLSTVLTPSLPLISPSPIDPHEIPFSSPNGPDESRLGYVAKEEAKVESEIVHSIISGDTDWLRPNSGQPVTISGHNICIRFRDERESKYRVWEWHGHVMTHDEDNGYSLEYIFGTYFERMR